jgi:hypothetical protein
MRVAKPRLPLTRQWIAESQDELVLESARRMPAIAYGPHRAGTL